MIASINAYVVWERKVEVLSVTKDTALLINASLLREWGSGFWNTQTFLVNFEPKAQAEIIDSQMKNVILTLQLHYDASVLTFSF